MYLLSTGFHQTVTQLAAQKLLIKSNDAIKLLHTDMASEMRNKDKTPKIIKNTKLHGLSQSCGNNFQLLVWHFVQKC